MQNKSVENLANGVGQSPEQAAGVRDSQRLHRCSPGAASECDFPCTKGATDSGRNPDQSCARVFLN